jgi:hypothetical protein
MELQRILARDTREGIAKSMPFMGMMHWLYPTKRPENRPNLL